MILYMVTLPRDAYLLNPVLAPMKRRRQRGRMGEAGATTAQTGAE
jgi:hypothetical protein